MSDPLILSLISMAALTVFFAAILAFADRKLRVREDPEVDGIMKLLPGANCGACGFLSCHDFAEHIVKEGADPALCRVADEESRQRICRMMGREAESATPMVLIVRCAAGHDDRKYRADYRGIRTCAAADPVFGAGMECAYGCLGFGDCVEACPFDALHMVNGLPRVDPRKCKGCGKCVAACPRNILSLEVKNNERLFYVACSSHDNTLRTRQVCAVGCIACGVCVKPPKEGFFRIEDNLSTADYDRQRDQEAVKAIQLKCPTKVIRDI